MLKMLKYEYRRGLFPLSIVFIIFGIIECYFLWGTATTKEEHTGTAGVLLVFASFACYLFVLVYGIVSYNNDMKKKSGYLVFMTPVSSYGVIGAKLLSTLLTGITLVAFIGILFVIDYSFAAKMYHFEGILDFFDMFLKEMGTDLKSSIFSIVALVVVFLIQFFMLTTIIYLAISLASTLLENKKGKNFLSGIFAFILYMIVQGISMGIIKPNMTPDMNKTVTGIGDAMGIMWPVVVLYLVIAILSFLASGALLEKKISL